MFQLMTVKPGIPSSTNNPTLQITPERAEIVFDKICFEYIPGQRILHDMSFTVPAGQNIAIVGGDYICSSIHPLILMVVIAGSGSGKSTLIRLLYRFFEPSSGSIRIGGQDITAVDMESLRKAIAIVPQDSVLFHNTIRHNIAYGNLSASEDQIFRYCTVKTNCV